MTLIETASGTSESKPYLYVIAAVIVAIYCSAVANVLNDVAVENLQVRKILQQSFAAPCLPSSPSSLLLLPPMQFCWSLLSPLFLTHLQHHSVVQINHNCLQGVQVDDSDSMYST